MKDTEVAHGHFGNTFGHRQRSEMVVHRLFIARFFKSMKAMSYSFLISTPTMLRIFTDKAQKLTPSFNNANKEKINAPTAITVLVQNFSSLSLRSASTEVI